MATSSTGRVVVVTGANKGVGYFIALHLANSGLFENVVLGCRDVPRAASAVENLQKETSANGNVSISSRQLTIGDNESHAQFAKQMQESFGKVDCLVNNAGFAFKAASSTPFEEQTKPTLDINFRGTIDFTEQMLPLVKKGKDPRIVNVASMSGRLSQLSPELQEKFSSDKLTMPQLHELVNDFERSVQDGSYSQKGFGSSNYGFSKLALIAATRVMARENPDIAINACCPGYCKTDMTSQNGKRDPKEGARNAVLPSTMENPPTGAFFSDYKEAVW